MPVKQTEEIIDQCCREYTALAAGDLAFGGHLTGDLPIQMRVRKHLTKGFLCAVLDLSGTFWPLLIPEYSGIKRRGRPFPGLRNPGIPFLFMSHMVKGDCLQLPLIGIVLCFVSLEF